MNSEVRNISKNSATKEKMRELDVPYYCEMCEIGFCEKADWKERHNVRSGFIKCVECDALYHPKYPVCKHFRGGE